MDEAMKLVGNLIHVMKFLKLMGFLEAEEEGGGDGVDDMKMKVKMKIVFTALAGLALIVITLLIVRGRRMNSAKHERAEVSSPESTITGSTSTECSSNETSACQSASTEPSHYQRLPRIVKDTLTSILLLSEGIYDETPEFWVGKHAAQLHGLKKLSVSRADTCGKYLVAQFEIMGGEGEEGEEREDAKNSTGPARVQKVAMIVFRGSAVTQDWITNFNFLPQISAFGTAHSGFLDHSSGLSLGYLSELAEKGHCLIFAGHSLGGAAASLAALKYLTSSIAASSDECVRQTYCVTFGAPWMATEETQQLVESQFPDNFFHFIAEDDIVPKLLLRARMLFDQYLGGESEIECESKTEEKYAKEYAKQSYKLDGDSAQEDHDGEPLLQLFNGTNPMQHHVVPCGEGQIMQSSPQFPENVWSTAKHRAIEASMRYIALVLNEVTNVAAVSNQDSDQSDSIAQRAESNLQQAMPESNWPRSNFQDLPSIVNLAISGTRSSIVCLTAMFLRQSPGLSSVLSSVRELVDSAISFKPFGHFLKFDGEGTITWLRHDDSYFDDTSADSERMTVRQFSRHSIGHYRQVVKPHAIQSHRGGQLSGYFSTPSGALPPADFVSPSVTQIAIEEDKQDPNFVLVRITGEALHQVSRLYISELNVVDIRGKEVKEENRTSNTIALQCCRVYNSEDFLVNGYHVEVETSFSSRRISYDNIPLSRGTGFRAAKESAHDTDVKDLLNQAAILSMLRHNQAVDSPEFAMVHERLVEILDNLPMEALLVPLLPNIGCNEGSWSDACIEHMEQLGSRLENIRGKGGNMVSFSQSARRLELSFLDSIETVTQNRDNLERFKLLLQPIQRWREWTGDIPGPDATRLLMGATVAIAGFGIAGLGTVALGASEMAAVGASSELVAGMAGFTTVAASGWSILSSKLSSRSRKRQISGAPSTWDEVCTMCNNLKPSRFDYLSKLPLLAGLTTSTPLPFHDSGGSGPLWCGERLLGKCREDIYAALQSLRNAEPGEKRDRYQKEAAETVSKCLEKLDVAWTMVFGFLGTGALTEESASHEQSFLTRHFKTSTRSVKTYRDVLDSVCAWIGKGETSNRSLWELEQKALEYCSSQNPRIDFSDGADTLRTKDFASNDSWLKMMGPAFHDVPLEFRPLLYLQLRLIFSIHHLRKLVLSVPLIGIAGTSNTGKTTLLRHLVSGGNSRVASEQGLPTAGIGLAHRTTFPCIYHFRGGGGGGARVGGGRDGDRDRVDRDGNGSATGFSVLDTAGADDQHLKDLLFPLLNLCRVVVVALPPTPTANGRSVGSKSIEAKLHRLSLPQSTFLPQTSILTCFNKADELLGDDEIHSEAEVVRVLSDEARARANYAPAFPVYIRDNSVLVQNPRWWTIFRSRDWISRKFGSGSGIHSLEDVAAWIHERVYELRVEAFGR